MVIQTINPATEAIINDYKAIDSQNALTIITNAHNAFLEWRQTSFVERSQLMTNMAALLRQKSKQLSHLITIEMGKPIAQSEAEIEKCAWVCEHYAKEAAAYLTPRTVQTEMAKTQVCYQPLGVIFAIMPWNYPFWQVFRFSAPTLMAGNAVFLKHAAVSCGAGRALAQLFKEAGFNPHLFQQAPMHNDIAEQVIAHPYIAAVSFTGSEKAGRIIGALAAANLKKAVLELGGNDAYLVLENADILLAAQNIVASRLNNCGQVCIAAKRVMVLNHLKAQLIQEISALMNHFKPGDPLDPLTTLGPLARADLRDELHRQVSDSIDQGATLLKGGYIPTGQGYFYPPTLLTDVKPGMPAFDEELFGPVIAIIGCKDEEEAISLANQSHFGLAAAIFIQDVERGEDIAIHELQVGTCFINTYVRSDPRLPFGGIKNSGFGRELSREGIHEFVNIKTIAVK